MVKAFIGLGSKLGDRKENIDNSIRLLTSLDGITLLSRASNFETEPVGPIQPWFINTAIKIETDLAPEELLSKCKEVERRIGRVDSLRWGPRLVDLDLLLFGERVIQTDRLALPHPEMEERKFVLIPLIELESELIHPELEIPLKKILPKTDEDKKVVKLQ
ncbi:2-amino-4-hydroxy-6-hydroxymethyldihydropteridine diphosphokinase [Candidatus Bipolaricaulota bacterium]|nr:2-amino-4-hydroxy-6-hydroxymethyldihydropteridine diphosphokinase [Candidatus Bipolaricaulota bacterium]